MTVAYHTTFRSCEEAHAAAQRRVTELHHAMQWLTWGHPPRSAAAVCVVCSRTLRIARTRHGLFQLAGDALRACVQPQVAPLDGLGVGRKTAYGHQQVSERGGDVMGLGNGALARARDIWVKQRGLETDLGDIGDPAEAQPVIESSTVGS